MDELGFSLWSIFPLLNLYMHLIGKRYDDIIIYWFQQKIVSSSRDKFIEKYPKSIRICRLNFVVNNEFKHECGYAQVYKEQSKEKSKIKLIYVYAVNFCDLSRRIFLMV